MKKTAKTILFFVIIITAILLIPSFAEEENIYVTPDGKPITGAVDIERNDWYNFLDYSDEIKTDGSADISDLLQACVNEHDNVFIPAGTYLFNTTVNLHSGSGIKGEDGTVIVSDTKCDLFKAYGEYDSENDIVTRIKNVLVSDLAYLSDDACTCYVLIAREVENVTLSGLTTKRTCALYLSSSFTGMLSKTPFSEDRNADYYRYMNMNLTVKDCVGDGVDQDVTNWKAQYIEFYCLDNFIIENINVKNYCCEVFWWGGIPRLDVAEPLKLYDDYYSYIGKIVNGIILRCRVVDSGMGMWGLCAKHLTIRDCYFENGCDGNMDFEACDDVLIYNNDIVNGFGGGPESLLGKIVYSHNRFLIREDWWRNYFFLHGSNDSSVAWEHQNIIMDGNTFTSYDRICLVAASIFEEASLSHFTFTNNKCFNTVVNSVSIKNHDNAPDRTEATDFWYYTVKDNEFTFDQPMGIYLAAIYAQTGINTTIEAVRDQPKTILPDTRTEGAMFTTVVISGNKVTSLLDEPINGILVTNNVTKDDYVATVTDNTLINCDLRIVNVSDTADCSATVKNNSVDNLIIEGVLDMDIDGNTRENGTALPASEMSINSLLTLKEKSTKSGVAYAFNAPYGLSPGIDGYGRFIWNGTQTYSLSKKITTDGSKTYPTNTSASYNVYWDELDGGIKLTVRLDVDKKAELTRKDKFVISFALDGSKSGNVTDTSVIGGAITVLSAGVVTKKEGTVFENENVSVTVLGNVWKNDNTSYTSIVEIVIPKEVKGVSRHLSAISAGESASIGFNIATYDDNNKYCSRGWTAGAAETDVSTLGTLYLKGEMARKKIGTSDDLYGDVNGDGKIKGNDATMLLKYLAGWDVTINESNSDVNGDGKIKGNDSTLLLKYLAGWDVKLGA